MHIIKYNNILQNNNNTIINLYRHIPKKYPLNIKI